MDPNTIIEALRGTMDPALREAAERQLNEVRAKAAPRPGPARPSPAGEHPVRRRRLRQGRPRGARGGRAPAKRAGDRGGGRRAGWGGREEGTWEGSGVKGTREVTSGSEAAAAGEAGGRASERRSPGRAGQNPAGMSLRPHGVPSWPGNVGRKRGGGGGGVSGEASSVEEGGKALTMADGPVRPPSRSLQHCARAHGSRSRPRKRGGRSRASSGRPAAAAAGLCEGVESGPFRKNERLKESQAGGWGVPRPYMGTV